jgi:hypothetical protein
MRGLIGHLLVLVACALGAAQSQAAAFSEDSVKAAFLYRFASYVEWPADAPAGPFVIAVAGDDAIVRQLQTLLPRIEVDGRPAQVRRATRPADLNGAHILYVGSGALPRSRALRAAALNRPILIVTDDVGGLDAGGVINFIPGDRNVRFEVSLVASDRARLKINSALLSVAARVERRPQAWAPCNGPCAERTASLAGESR